MFEIIAPILFAVLAVLAFIALVKSCWKIAGTNEVLIVTGLGKTSYVSGGGRFVIPLLQRTDRMTLEKHSG